ncbi:hypothetical protein ABT160_24315 [Streptomyces sp. NPDC001941]|uniref:hypothetical protein n=1 Tax=Streptomyces sp. NPDC001941 TaxID=3154659 RepID=UPI00331F0E4A
MTQAPKVIGVLTEPAPASWWRRNRHRVYLALGLWAGWQLCTHLPGQAATPTPRPAYNGPATPGPDSSVKPLPQPTSHTR